MPLTINTNMAASRASYFLSKNNDALQQSLDRLSSGRKITKPADDAGGLAVSMKMQGSIDTLKGAANNVANAISFLQVQDGILDSAAQIAGRISELYGLTKDVLKSPADIQTYRSEIQDLAGQLNDLKSSSFNAVALFGDANGKNITGTSTINVSTAVLDNSVTTGFNVDTDANLGGTTGEGAVDFADNSITETSFSALQVSQLLSNIAALRAANGGEANRLQFEQENIATQISNMEAALGRILDVDIAAETTNLAKQQILVQASASMVTQANTANQVALMLLQ